MKKKLLSFVLCMMVTATMLSGCGASSDSANEAQAQENTESVEETQAETSAETQITAASFYGTWKYEKNGEDESVLVINPNGTMDIYNPDMTSAGSVGYAFDSESLGITVTNENGELIFQLNLQGDKLIDGDGDTLGRVNDLAASESGDAYSGSSPLTKTIEFADANGITISYPEQMNATPRDDIDRTIVFQPVDTQEGSDDYYSAITTTLVKITGYDDYMTKGQATAEKYMQTMLNDMVSQTFGDKIIKFVGTNFENGGSYWGIMGFAWMDSSIFNPAPANPVRATVELRYTGPNGYAIMTYALSTDARIANYYEMACHMTDSVSLGGTWTTAAKEVPVAAKPKTQPKNAKKAKGRKGEEIYTYYWTDADGDVWFWNGYEDVFMGFSNDCYEEDGQYYESNDAGWDTDSDYDYYYDDDWWEDGRGDFFSEDTDINQYSDPGDGVDAWSDPGDTYDYDTYSEDSYDDGGYDSYDDGGYDSYDDGGYDSYDDGGYDSYDDDY